MTTWRSSHAGFTIMNITRTIMIMTMTTIITTTMIMPIGITYGVGPCWRPTPVGFVWDLRLLSAGQRGAAFTFAVFWSSSVHRPAVELGLGTATAAPTGIAT